VPPGRPGIVAGTDTVQFDGLGAVKVTLELIIRLSLKLISFATKAEPRLFIVVLAVTVTVPVKSTVPPLEIIFPPEREMPAAPSRAIVPPVVFIALFTTMPPLATAMDTFRAVTAPFSVTVFVDVIVRSRLPALSVPKGLDRY
jgi:hypothetical protein